MRLVAMSDFDELAGPSAKKPRLDADSAVDNLLAAFKKPEMIAELQPYTDLRRLVLDDDVICVSANGKSWLNTRLLIFILRMCPALEVLNLYSSEAHVYKLTGRHLDQIFNVMPQLKELRVECLEFKDNVFHSIRKIKSLERLSLYVPTNAHIMHWDCYDFVDNLPNLRLILLVTKMGRYVMNSHQIQTRRDEGVSFADFLFS